MATLFERLAGTWTGTGRGSYPTIRTFTYFETIVFEPLPGKSVLAYTQRTRSPDGDPLHAEAGFYRFDGDDVELVIAQPTGIVEAHRGTAVGDRIDLTPVAIAATPSAADVQEVHRRIEMIGDSLRYELDMAAVGQPLTLHLVADLRRSITM